MTNFERITASPEALAEFLEVPFDNCDEQFRRYLLDWLNSEAEEQEDL